MVSTSLRSVLTGVKCIVSMPCTMNCMKVRVEWPNAACSLHLKVGVERPKFSPHDFAGELTQTTTDHVPRPFFPPTQNKNGKKRSGNVRLASRWFGKLTGSFSYLDFST